MKDLVVILILVAILGSAAWYVYKSKKSGKKCIGCPDGCCSSAKGETSCAGNCGHCSSCNH